MITFMEKERKWILSDPGEISFDVDGRLQQSITQSMFIESPSSLDLMLGMQKKPSWDCGFTDASKTLETKCLKQNVLKSKALHHKRKRKASWGGGFEDKGKLSQSDFAENRFVNGEWIGYTPTTENFCNLQIQYVANTKVLLEGLQMDRSLQTKFQVERNQRLPPKKLNTNLEKKLNENCGQQCGQEIRHKANISGFSSLIRNSRLKKRLKKLETSEIVENTHCREFSGSFQQLKVSQNVADLLTQNDSREAGSFTQTSFKPSFTQLLSAITVENQASIGDIETTPPSSKENIRCKGDGLMNHVKKKNLQVTALNIHWKERNDFLLTGSLENRRIGNVEQHGHEDGRLFSHFEQKKIPVSSSKKQLVSQRATPLYKVHSKKCYGKTSTHRLCSNSSACEKFEKGYSKSTESERARSPSNFCASKYKAENDMASLNLENFGRGYPKTKKWETTRIPRSPSASTNKAGKGSASSTLENTKRYPKPNKSEKAKFSSICGTSTVEPEHCSKKEDPKEQQTVSKDELQGPALNRGGNGTSDEGSKQRHMNGDDASVKEDCDMVQGENARVRTKKLLQLFHKIHKQFRGGHKEVDARNIIVKIHPEYLVNGSDSIYGDVPGVEAGDKFNYRVEMDLVGLHHQFRRGIDVIPASKSNWCIPGIPKPVSVAACIVVAGGYVDNRDEGDIIIYTGEGGNNHFHDKGPSKDQMLTIGNKALRHSRMLNLSVRVIRKFDVRPPTKPYYRYDGLYEVVDMKKARSGGHHKKALSHGENCAKQQINKCKTVSLKPLVYKFLLVRKSAREKYKDMNLWTYKPTSFPQVIIND